MGYVATTGEIQGVDVEGNFAYLAASDSGLQIVDISNPIQPAQSVRGRSSLHGRCLRFGANISGPDDDIGSIRAQGPGALGR